MCSIFCTKRDSGSITEIEQEDSKLNYRNYSASRVIPLAISIEKDIILKVAPHMGIEKIAIQEKGLVLEVFSIYFVNC